MVEAIPSTPEKSPYGEHINWASKWAMDLHGTNAKLNVYTHQNSWCNVWHRIKLLKYEQYKFSSCMNVGVVQDINGMDKPPLNVDNAIIHEEYLVGLHYNYYKNDLIKRGGDFARNFVHQGFYTKHRLWLHIEDHWGVSSETTTKLMYCN